MKTFEITTLETIEFTYRIQTESREEALNRTDLWGEALHSDFHDTKIIDVKQIFKTE